MFTIINGISVDLKQYLNDEALIHQLEQDDSFTSNVSFGFEKEFVLANDSLSGDEVLETVVNREIQRWLCSKGLDKICF